MASNAGPALLVIPGEPTFTRTIGLPPIRVALPLEGEMRSDPFWFLVFTLFGLFAVVLLFVALTTVLSERASVVTVVPGMLVAVVSVIFGINTVGYYLDLLRSRPILLLEETGFWDRRAADRPLRWADVARARALVSRGQYLGVELWLRRPFAARRIPASWATIRYLFRRRDDELIVSVDFLRNRRVLALAMLELVTRHGGVVVAR